MSFYKEIEIYGHFRCSVTLSVQEHAWSSRMLLIAF